ncbi:hypothetical protein IJD34_07180 [bacterium]|nr:hypothetical protein [bacterium]
MRIQPINNKYNKSNISHKAYFKPSATLSQLCEKAPKDSNLVDIIGRFKNSLPNHELGIVKVFSTRDYPKAAVYRVTNHTLNKVENIDVTENKWALSVLLNRIYLYRETLFSNEENTAIKDLYKELTTKSK